MSKDYVSKEIARKLQEKGFEWCRVTTYNPKTKVKNNHIEPTISQVLKWLREEKKLYIEIWWLTQHTTKNLKGFQFIITPMCENPQRETDLELYCDYETAAIKGIEYVIDNVI